MARKIKLAHSNTTNQPTAWVDGKDLFQHVYVVGKPRQGKSTFLLTIIEQIIDYCGMIVLDPAGNFAPVVAGMANKDCLVYVDRDHPLVLNPVGRSVLGDDKDWEITLEEFCNIMDQCVTASTSGSTKEQTEGMKDLLTNAWRIMEEPSIEWLSNLLKNKNDMRKRFASDEFWGHFDDLGPKGWEKNKEQVESAKRVAIRLNGFFNKPTIAKFTLGKNQFEVKDIADKQQTFVFDLHGFSKGQLIYLGNIITNYLITYYRYQATEQSRPLFLIVDEFQLFLNEEFGQIMSQCPKYNIGLFLAHQNHAQIKKNVLDTIIGDSGIMAVFATGHNEAIRMANEIKKPVGELRKLKKHQCFIDKGGDALDCTTYAPPNVQPYIPPIVETIPEEPEPVPYSPPIIPEPILEPLPLPVIERPQGVYFRRDEWIPY